MWLVRYKAVSKHIAWNVNIKKLMWFKIECTPYRLNELCMIRSDWHVSLEGLGSCWKECKLKYLQVSLISAALKCRELLNRGVLNRRDHCVELYMGYYNKQFWMSEKIKDYGLNINAEYGLKYWLVWPGIALNLTSQGHTRSNLVEQLD